MPKRRLQRKARAGRPAGSHLPCFTTQPADISKFGFDLANPFDIAGIELRSNDMHRSIDFATGNRGVVGWFRQAAGRQYRSELSRFAEAVGHDGPRFRTQVDAHWFVRMCAGVHDIGDPHHS